MMWNDFVFANGSFDTAPGTGLQVAITGLAPTTIYPITIWAFDDASNPSPAGVNRAADWSGGGGSGTLSFPGDPDPASLADYFVTFNATSDAAGALTLSGIVAAANPSNSHNVFINGLEIGDAIPEPSVALLGVIGLAGVALRRRRR
jgi:MYXO-CTERM domain-containing protein